MSVQKLLSSIKLTSGNLIRVYQSLFLMVAAALKGACPPLCDLPLLLCSSHLVFTDNKKEELIVNNYHTVQSGTFNCASSRHHIGCCLIAFRCGVLDTVPLWD